MGKDYEETGVMGRRGVGGGYHGLERRNNLDQGKFIVVTVYRSVFYGLLAFNIVLTAAVLSLIWFANIGARYTAEDGDREEAGRVQSDKDLHARIDALHPPVWTHE